MALYELAAIVVAFPDRRKIFSCIEYGEPFAAVVLAVRRAADETLDSEVEHVLWKCFCSAHPGWGPCDDEGLEMPSPRILQSETLGRIIKTAEFMCSK